MFARFAELSERCESIKCESPRVPLRKACASRRNGDLIPFGADGHDAVDVAALVAFE